MTTLNEQEREVIDQALRGPMDRQVPTRGAMVTAAVEAILTARLARVEALATYWERTPALRRGTCAADLRAALASDPTHTQDGTQA